MEFESGKIEVIDDVSAKILAGMSPAQKWLMIDRMVIEARETMTLIVRASHPSWTDPAVKAEVRRRMTGG